MFTTYKYHVNKPNILATSCQIEPNNSQLECYSELIYSICG